MLDKSAHRTVQSFIETLVEKFHLPTQHFKEQGYLIKELTQERVKFVHEILKDDQLALLSHYIVKNYKQPSEND